jgi:hypothetical protein
MHLYEREFIPADRIAQAQALARCPFLLLLESSPARVVPAGGTVQLVVIVPFFSRAVPFAGVHNALWPSSPSVLQRAVKELPLADGVDLVLFALENQRRRLHIAHINLDHVCVLRRDAGSVL